MQEKRRQDIETGVTIKLHVGETQKELKVVRCVIPKCKKLTMVEKKRKEHRDEGELSGEQY